MEIVSDAVRELVSRQVHEHGVVVWFDPDRDYDAVPETLGEAIVERYHGSFLALRRAIDDKHVLDGETPPRLVVYVPLSRAASGDALVELTEAGVELYPGASARPCNTRLALIARRALEPLLGTEGAAAAEKKAADGQLTLAELDRLAEQGQGLATGVVSLIFGTTNPVDVALAFLADEKRDAALVGKAAIPELARLFGAAFDADLGDGTSPSELREHLARHVLVTDLVDSLGEMAPPAVAALPHATSAAGHAACSDLARTWRLRRDLQEGHAVYATRVEASLDLDSSTLDLSALARVESFLAGEEGLQASVEKALLADAQADLVELARERQSSFWSTVRPAVQARWGLIAAAGQVLLEADRVAAGLKGPASSARDLFRAYAEGEHPWCLLDTAHRHMERRAQAFDFAPGAHERLEALVTRARQRYMAAASDLAERFVDALQAADYTLADVPRQRETFRRYVAEARERGKTAYVLVDALRYEMARELVDNLGEGFVASIEPVLGSLPSITEVGMAALMPRADTGAILTQVADSKLALEIDGATLKNRKDRVAFLKAHLSGQVFEGKLEDLIPPKRGTQSKIQAADFVLITSQEIDALCEGDNVPLARRTMDDVLWELRRAFRVLLDLGVATIVVSADHGYLFGEELDVDMKVDPPGGQTVDLHRRVWVGLGGAASDAYVRLKASDVGLGGALEIAVPRGLAGFKVAGGSSAYFHGGLAPQEIVVPVLVVGSAARSAGPPAGIDWELRAGSKRITTRFFSVSVSGTLTDLFNQAVPRVRLEVRVKTVRISRAVSAAYGLEGGTGDIELRLSADDPHQIEPNTVALQIEPTDAGASAHVYLVDATTGNELKRLGPIDLAIAL